MPVRNTVRRTTLPPFRESMDASPSNCPTPELFLSPAEIHCLTGYMRPKDQVRWLASRGWLFEADRWGSPKIARQEFERRMVKGGGKPQKKPATPNFDAAR